MSLREKNRRKSNYNQKATSEKLDSERCKKFERSKKNGGQKSEKSELSTQCV